MDGAPLILTSGQHCNMFAEGYESQTSSIELAPNAPTYSIVVAELTHFAGKLFSQTLCYTSYEDMKAKSWRFRVWRYKDQFIVRSAIQEQWWYLNSCYERFFLKFILIVAIVQVLNYIQCHGYGFTVPTHLSIHLRNQQV